MAFDKHWSAEDIEILRSSYKNLEFEELCIRLNRSHNAVRWKASQLFLSIPKVDYSKEEDSFLVANYKKMNQRQLAEEMKRSPSSVSKRLYKLLIKKVPVYTRMLSEFDDHAPIHESLAESYRYMLFKMQIGQSFVYPDKHRQHIANQKIFFPKNKYITKKINKDERRCWRIA